MENNTDSKMENSNGNVRKGKPVTFNQDTQVFVFDSQSNDAGDSNRMPRYPVRRMAQGSRVRRYDQSVAWRSISLHPRPPALPPRNPVQVNPAGPKPSPSTKNESSVVTNVREKVRIFRRCPDTRSVTERLEVAPLVPHYRMKVPDTPPPSKVSLVRSSAATKSAPSTSYTPSGPSVDDDDDNDREDSPGRLTGCFLFIISCSYASRKCVIIILLVFDFISPFTLPSW